MTCLIKRLRRMSPRLDMLDCENALTAADRIEELLELNKELTLQLLAAHGQAADALDKLTKAMKALRKIADYTHIGEFGQAVTQHAEARIARAVLAELEGKEEATSTAWRGRE